MKFLHCADLHIGCCVDDTIRFGDFGARFSDIVETAMAEHAGAVLISGDLFHQRNIDPRTLAMAQVQLKRLQAAGIAVIATEGNHDKAFYRNRTSWLEYLHHAGLLVLLRPTYQENRAVLDAYDGEQGAIYEYAGVRFVGFGYLGSSAGQRLKELSLEPYDGFTVGLLHAGVDRLVGLDLGAVCTEDLMPYRACIEYFALGHVHTRYDDGWAYNPGAPECVHMSEGRRGEKGYYLVETSGKAFTVQFIASRRRPTHFIQIDVTGQTMEELTESAIMHCTHVQASDMLCVDVTGTLRAGTLEHAALYTALNEAYQPVSLEIRDQTSRDRADDEAYLGQQAELRVMRSLAEEEGLSASAGDMALLFMDALKDGAPDALYATLSRWQEELEDAH